MQKQSLWLFTGLLCLGLITGVNAQKEFTFGKPEKADITMTELPSDTSAGAYVLHHSNFIFFNLSGAPLMMRTVNRRVKLLKRSGFDEADIEIYLQPRYERVTSLKAMITLPSGEKVKLKNSDFIKEDYDEDTKVIKFTFPQVTEGAIIEYTYRKSDENFTILPKFFFQENIPVRWAEFRAEIPEYYRYVSLSNSFDSWSESESKVDNGQVSGISMQVQKMKYAKADVPAYEIQPYTNNFIDYLPKIYMQLQSVAYPRQAVQDVISTWGNLAQKLSTFEWFGKKYNNRGDVKKALDDMSPYLASATSEVEKAAIAYRYIGQHMNWNGDYRISGEDRLNQCWEKRSGNSAEINMLLIGVLQSLQIECQPLLVSLRDRGAHITTYPVFDQFDHLMVLATLDGTPIILDVNDPSRPMGTPRFQALNSFGWVANPVNPHWIEINAPKMSQTVVAEIEIDEEGMATVAAQTRMSGYYALDGRNALKGLEDEVDGPLMSEIVDVFPDAEFMSRELPEEDDINKDLGFKMKAKVPLAQMADDYIYLSPLVIHALEEGLADTEQRIAPVDLGCPKRFRYIAKVKVPEGYEVEELPQSTKMRSEDGSVVVTYSALAGDGAVSLNYTLDINRATFSPDEYYALKEIFERAIELQESLFVFRKAK